jgi:hypothetical protein
MAGKDFAAQWESYNLDNPPDFNRSVQSSNKIEKAECLNKHSAMETFGRAE